MSQETFRKFGHKFEDRIIQAVLSDVEFFQKIYPLSKKEFFSESHGTIWNLITDFFEKYKTVPTYENLGVTLSKLNNEDIIDSCKIIILHMQKDFKVKEVEQAKEEAFEFLEEKEMESAILECAVHLKEGRKDMIKPRIEKAMKHIYISDTGHDYFEGLSDRTSETIRKSIPTGLKLLDDIDYLDGGLAGGEIGVMMAPTGGGKSYWLMQMGYGALKAGYNVVHYTFELSEINIGKRYDAKISGFPIKEIRNNEKDVQKILSEFKGGRLIIKEFPTRTANIHKIKFHIDRLQASGIPIDLVVLDYADLMLSTRSYEQKTWELEAIYEELRSFSMETKIPIWTASQTNRAGLDEDIIGLDKIADAYSKAQVADFIGTFSRNKYEKETNGGKFYIAKNRMGFDGKVWTTYFDPARSVIQLSEPDQIGGDFIVNVDKEFKDGVGELWTKFKDNKGVN